MVEENGGHQMLYWHVKWWEGSKTEGTNDLDRIFQFVCIGFYSNIQADNQNNNKKNANKIHNRAQVFLTRGMGPLVALRILYSSEAILSSS